MPAPNDNNFPVGSRVILQNLSKGIEFNGKVGVVKSKVNDENQRQQVLLIQSGKTLGIKPFNLKYEPRSVNSLSISELKILLTLKEVTTLSGYDKSQLREMLKIKTDSEEEIAQLLYQHLEEENERMAANPNVKGQKGGGDQASMLANASPDQLRQQAQMMRSMPPAQIRRMNPQMAGFTDAQIGMAANQMEMMANNPDMLKQMTEQMKNMSPAEMEQMKRMQAGGAPPSASDIAAGGGSNSSSNSNSGGTSNGNTGNTANGNAAPASASQMANGMQNMANMSPEQLKYQAEMMKSMDPDTLRSMNPAMAGWGDEQIKMAIQQMETMANNPDMMKQVSEQMKGMKPEEIEKIRNQGANGFGGAGGGAVGAGADGMPANPMDMLNNADPAQIKSMLKMVRDNPKMMKDMLRSSNPGMADKLSDEQIQKTIDAFAGMDEKKIGWLLKALGWVQEFKNSSKAKMAAFAIVSMFVFVMGMLVYLVKSQKGGDVVSGDEDLSNEVPPVPNMDSEF